MHNEKHVPWIKGSCCCGLWSPSLYRAHLLKLHRQRSPRRRPASCETPGHLSPPPGLLAEGPLPTPWRPESPAANTREIYRGWSLHAERLHPVLYMDPGRAEGKQKQRRETGHCDVFTFAIHYLLEAFWSVCMQIKVSDARTDTAHSGVSLFRSTNVRRNPTICCLCLSNLNGGIWQHIFTADSSDPHMDMYTHKSKQTITHTHTHTHTHTLHKTLKARGKLRSEGLDDTNLFKYALNSVAPGWKTPSIPQLVLYELLRTLEKRKESITETLCHSSNNPSNRCSPSEDELLRNVPSSRHSAGCMKGTTSGV